MTKIESGRPKTIDAFIAYWKESSASERSNYALFLDDLATVLGVARPMAATKDRATDQYVIDRSVLNPNSGTTNYIDLYKAGCFVLETKQGSDPKSSPTDARQVSLDTGVKPSTKTAVGHGVRDSKAWRNVMDKALNQARGYARHIEAETGTAPPFVIVADIGYQFEIFADFSGRGTNYTFFPDARRAVFSIEDLAQEEVQNRLRAIWEAPETLDKSKEAARVTREIADELAAVARSFANQGHSPADASRFLMQCVFAMFAEDVGLLDNDSFTELLKCQADHNDPEITQVQLQELFERMNTGGVSTVMGSRIKHFNGGLYADVTALPVNAVQREYLIRAAERDWRTVEPAIFGTLVEHALEPDARRNFGAHFTPRAYVERLVVPTIIEPLRAELENVRASAAQLHDEDRDKEALKLLKAFRKRLASTRVLDPACGSGNFLYVSMELMKDLEAEVTALLNVYDRGAQADMAFQEITVEPSQFLGIEPNPWAAKVAEMVLWIGYLQWHYRNTGTAIWSIPILRDYGNVVEGDAVLTYSKKVVRLDDNAKPVTRYDGITTRRHPGTGENIPDESARITVYDYPDAKPAKWPEAEFIVGNPPFHGASKMRERLGDGYAEAVRKVYPHVPESVDFVIYWWDKAAALAKRYNSKTGKGLRRFGFITTNSFRQTFNRRVADGYLRDPKKPLSLLFAIPDHPWVDSEDGAAVRIAMTVAQAGRREGKLLSVERERKTDGESLEHEIVFSEQVGRIFANLRVGPDVGSSVALKANQSISSPGVKLHGSGFIVSPERARELGLGTVEGLDHHIRDYRNGRDLLQTSRGVMLIDLFGLSEQEAQERFPAVMNHLRETVKPERDTNRRDTYRLNWWIHGEPRSALRPVLSGLSRYIATVETSKHSIFQFLDASVLPDNMLVAVGLDSPEHLAILSGHVHTLWALAAGGTLEDRPRYNKSVIFDPFPFPKLLPKSQSILADLGESLDAHRKRVLDAHPDLTLTRLYNALEAYRALEASGSNDILEGRLKADYNAGEVGTLLDIHVRIDRAVADAYGWPSDLSDENILGRLVDLNHVRAQEELAGRIQWLRPDYQNPKGQGADAKTAEADLSQAIVIEPRTWPKTLPDRIAVVREILSDVGAATPEEVGSHIKGAKAKTVTPFLDTLVATGLAEIGDDGRYAA